MSSLASEMVAIIGSIPAAERGGTTTNMTGFDLGKFHQALFIVSVGAATGVTDCKLQESASTSSGYTDISDKAVTQFSATDDNKQALINLNSSELGDGKRYVRAVLTCGAGTTIVGVIAIGFVPRFLPGSDNDATSVKEIIP